MGTSGYTCKHDDLQFSWTPRWPSSYAHGHWKVPEGRSELSTINHNWTPGVWGGPLGCFAPHNPVGLHCTDTRMYGWIPTAPRVSCFTACFLRRGQRLFFHLEQLPPQKSRRPRLQGCFQMFHPTASAWRHWTEHRLTSSQVLTKEICISQYPPCPNRPHASYLSADNGCYCIWDATKSSMERIVK